MTKISKNLIADRITQIRSRLITGLADGALYDSSLRMTELKSSLESLKGLKNTELLRHFPVASIAVLESHFRATVAVIIDEGGEHTARALSLITEKIKASEIIANIHKKTISIGEIIAYSLPFSSLSHLESVYDSLLGQSFKHLSKSAQDPFSARNETPNNGLISNDIPTLWSTLNQTFYDRHILAHESATKFEMSYEKAWAAVTCVSLIIAITEAVLWSTIWRDKPLTQYEMNTAALQKYKHTRNRLAQAIRMKRREGNTSELSRFRKLHFGWKSWAFDWCTFCSDRFTGGSIRPLIYASELTEALEVRIKQIESVSGF